MTRFKFVDRQFTPHLYHWQRFVPEHLETLLGDNVIWFSRPDTFNDPWDCKPCFASNFANDPVEVERHVEDYAEITRKHRPDIPESFILQRQQEFRENPALLAAKVSRNKPGHLARDCRPLPCLLPRSEPRQLVDVVALCR